ncbi:hypothetical protein EK21DRAFT_84835 [Setomelanomma holmii]|uniref:Extracellular serine-rich protein n=1 Tax=Setomelanomma holmii TaxID=210430 RepID=A0A9P4HKJ6_9PLEO|nr:hypothetical protein EK21DRAFT_84835 [Setomelanomma holmii]
MAVFTSRFRPPLLFFTIQFLSGCLAQDSTSESGSSATAQARGPDATTSIQASSTSSAPAQTHTIEVGLADHKFRPDTTEAAIGDTIEFRFYPANHSIVRAEYGFPCIPYEMTGSNKAGFFSGFNPVDKVLDDPPKYSIRVNTTDPVFFYCSAPGSCITYGMVGSININSSQSIDKQRSLAMDSAYMLNPGEPFPAESPLPSINPATSSGLPDSGSGKKSLGTGAIAGIVVGAIAGLILGALLFFFWGRTKTLKDEVERKESSITRRISPSSSAANMLQSPPPASSPAGNATGLGLYQQYAPNHISPTSPDQRTGTSAPSYFCPQFQSQNGSQLDIEHKYRTASPPPQAHPAFSTPTPSASALSTSPPPPDTTFQISPSSYSDTETYPYFAHLVTQYHHTPATSQPRQHFSIHSPGPEQAKLGPYGQKRQEMSMAPAPPYGWHVNLQQGPVEIEGETARARIGARWEEVQPGEGKEGLMF